MERAILLDKDNENNWFPSHGESKQGKRPKLPWDFEGSYVQLENQYFLDTFL